MKIELYSDNGQMTLTVKASPKEIRVTDELDSMIRLQSRGFLIPKIGRTAVFRQYVITYSGHECISLEQYLKSGITRQDFFRLIDQLAEATRSIEGKRHFLKKLLLDSRYAFVNPSTKQLFLVYVPLAEGSSEADVSGFISSIITLHMQACDGMDAGYAEELREFIASQSVYSAEAVSEYIISHEPAASGRGRNVEYEESGFMTDNPAEYYEHYGTAEIADDDTGTGETVTFHRTFSPANVCARLVRVSTGETITTNKTVFRIGKDPAEADYCITDNGAVSRTHADIIIRGSRYYIMDHSSTNGTYINGMIIPPDTETEIYDGSSLRLGNEELRFYID